ncbi:MAG: hypothetical protein LBR33_02855 [Propionibacteriaceae bacterium]|jgi:hypothetical protein|nr:hypothetical protein [Propionibacteriaceae bacterium]
MLDATALQPPVDYLALWAVLAAVAFLAGLVFLVYASFRLPRLRLGRLFRWHGQDDGPTVQQTYLEQIDGVERDYADGAIDSRTAHQRLAALVRDFAFAASGLPTQDATLADLRERGLDRVAAVIERYYPAEFARSATADPAAAVALAREVVAQWH